MSELKEKIAAGRALIAENLKQCAVDEMAWRKTGILPDGPLRTAGEAFEKLYPDTSFYMAKEELYKQAMQMIIAVPTPAAPQPSRSLSAELERQMALASTGAPQPSNEFSGNPGELAESSNTIRNSRKVVDSAADLPSVIPTPGTPQPMTDDVSYEIVQDDMVVASASGPGAEREIMHYAAQYQQDGPLEIFKVVRTALLAAQEVAK